MCRWLAYLGSPLALEDVLVRPNHSLIDQSLLARDLYLPGDPLASQFRGSAFPTNGDGFGVRGRAAGARSASTARSNPPGTARICATSPHRSSRAAFSRT